MKTLEQIIEEVKNGKESQCLDGRDFARLIDFVPVDKLELFGFKEIEGKTYTPSEFTKENVLKQLQKDVDFGFEKALNKRGISSTFMYEVVKMWMWVLEDELAEFDSYAMYGLPLFKAVALKYGFENPIGDDTGSESKYNSR